MLARGTGVHAASVSQVVLKALQGEIWLCGKSLWWSPWVVALARRPVSAMDLLGALSIDLWKCRAGEKDQSPASVFCRPTDTNE